MRIQDRIAALFEGRAFPIGTTRQWQRGPHAKTDAGWKRHGQAHLKNVDQPLPDNRVSAFVALPVASAEVNTALEAIASRITLRQEWTDYEVKSKAAITKVLKDAYQKGGVPDMKQAAYKLEADGKVSHMMLGSVLKGIVRDREIDGEKVQFPDKSSSSTLLMYADDLEQGR